MNGAYSWLRGDNCGLVFGDRHLGGCLFRIGKVKGEDNALVMLLKFALVGANAKVKGGSIVHPVKWSSIYSS